MSELREFYNTLNINIYESLVLLTTFILTLLTDLTVAIPIGFVLAIILFMKRMSDSMEMTPLMTSKVNDQKIFSQEIGEYSNRILIYELNGPMFFGSVHQLLHLQKRISRDIDVLILRFRYVPIVDTSGLIKLKHFLKDLEKKETAILFSGVNERLKTKFLKTSLLDESRMVPDISDALRLAEKILKKEKTA